MVSRRIRSTSVSPGVRRIYRMNTEINHPSQKPSTRTKTSTIDLQEGNARLNVNARDEEPGIQPVIAR